MKNLTCILLLLSFLGCNSPQELDSCLQALEIVSAVEYNNGEIEYVVIGEISDFSKGADDLLDALHETLNLNERTFNGCLVFEETFPQCFGYFILDSRAKSGIDDDITLHKKGRVKMRRIKLKNAIPETYRKQKNVQYVYLVQEVESLEE